MDGDLLLIQRMKSGDEQAIEEFVQKYYSDIWRYLRRNLSGGDVAEDLAQETFERFFENFTRYVHYGKAKNYLYVIAGNLCRNYYKKTKEELPGEWEEKFTGEANPYLAVDRRLDINSALKELPYELREVVLLYYFQELKIREIAVVLNIGVPLVKYRLKRAKKLLRDWIGEEEREWDISNVKSLL